MTAPNPLGDLLRQWRGDRSTSQLALALDAGISQRHLSFIESGRSIPSRAVLADVADALDIPFRERNQLLLAAGYAPAYVEDSLDAPELKSVTRALKRVLHQHEPFPAIVMDRYWNVVMTNDAAPVFFGAFIDLAKFPRPRNMLHLMFDPTALRPAIANWNETAPALLDRVRREATGHVLDARTRDLLASLEALGPIDPPNPKTPPQPVVPLAFAWRGHVLNYFSLVSTIGTPQTLTTQELRVECMFPADDATEALHADLMRQNG